MPDHGGMIHDFAEEIRRKMRDLFRRVAQLEMAAGQDVIASVSYSGSHDDLSDVRTDNHHDPVTLSSAEIQAILDLSTQALDLDTQTAHLALMGPTSGAAAKPAFRAVVEADISDLGTYLTPADVLEGPDIDLVTTGSDVTVGRGGDTILLYDSGGDPVSEYAATDAGLTSALAAMADGDVCELCAGTISGGPWTLAHGTLRGISPEGSVLDGQITTGAGVCAIENLSIERSENDAGAIYGIADGGGTCTLTNVRVDVANATGAAYAIYMANGGRIDAGKDGAVELLAEIGSDGYAAYIVDGDLYHWVGVARGTTALQPYNV